MRDGFLEIDMASSGLSVVSNLMSDFSKKTWGSKIGAEHLEMPWIKIQHLQKNCGIGAYLFQSFVLLFVNVSSICLGKDFAPLHCTGIAEAPYGLWMGYGCCVLMGRAHLTDSMLFVCVCSSVLWGNISQTVWFCTSLQQLEWRWKASHRHFVLAPACGNYSVKTSQDYSMCLSHPAITSAHPYIQNIHLETGLLLCLALELDFWLSFGYRSGPRQKNRKCTR